MSRKVTRRDVARQAGVSDATVSYVLNGSPKIVSPETQQRVLDAARQLHYRPDQIARSLKTGKTNVIGLVIPIISSPLMAVLANNVHESLLRSGYSLTFANTHEDPALENRTLELLLSQSIDGVIISPVSKQPPNALRTFAALDIPIVFLDRYVSGFNADIVTTDNVIYARQATDYLLRRGCKRPLCVSFSPFASSALDRVEGYLRALNEHDFPTVVERDVLVVEDPTGRLVESAFLAHIDTHGTPDAIVCLTPEAGVGVLRAFRRRNIPFDPQSMVVFDADWAQLLTPAVPAIEQDSRSMAETAVQLLVDRLAGKQAPYRTVFFDARVTFP
jgi:LacI family transcriptional regulator